VLQGSGPVRITRSAFTRNHAVRDGGGLSLGQGTDMSVANSLLADNVADLYGGGLDVYLGSNVELSWLTVTGNYAGTRGGGVSLNGGEILGALLITGNRDGSSFHAPDCLTRPTGTVSSGYNLIGAVSDANCVLTGDLTGNQIGVDIDLAPVTLLGADLPYAAPRPGSIAVGAVPASRCRRGSGLYEIHDQLDHPRPVDGTCTIGAIEGTSDVIFSDGLEDRYPGEP
jgi:hypothetical protein